MATQRRVVVVEDDKDIRDTLVEVLEEEGYESRAFPNGAEALAYLRAGGPASLILLDLAMPVMDGQEFCAELRKHPGLSTIPVILLTADGSARHKASKLPVAGGLTKPVRLHELLEAVERHCG